MLCSVPAAAGDAIALLCFAVTQLSKNLSHPSTSESACTFFTSNSQVSFLLFVFIFLCRCLPETDFHLCGRWMEAASIPACLRQAVGQENRASLIYGCIFRYVHCSYAGLDFPRCAGSFGKGPGACSRPGSAPSHARAGLLQHPAVPGGAG